MGYLWKNIRTEEKEDESYQRKDITDEEKQKISTMK